MQYDEVCSDFSRKIQGDEFIKDCRLLSMGGCDMILGMDWIDQFSPVQLHTRLLNIGFEKEER